MCHRARLAYRSLHCHRSEVTKIVDVEKKITREALKKGPIGFQMKAIRLVNSNPAVAYFDQDITIARIGACLAPDTSGSLVNFQPRL